MKKNNLPPAVVVGLCAHGLHIVRNLSQHGVPVIAVESNFEQPTAKTKYGEKLSCDDINSESLVDCLENIYERFKCQLPIFLTNDKMIENIENHWERLDGKFLFPFEKSLLQPLMDKHSLHRIAIENGFKLPRSYTLKNPEDLELLPGDLNYPVILKPSIPMGSFKTRICENKTAVEQLLALQTGGTMILQEWIPGKEEHLYFCGYYIDNNFACVSQFSGKKTLCYPDVTGNTGAAEPFYYPNLLDQGLQFFKKLGFRGLCSIEYKGLDPDDPYFIEVTVGRTDWWVMCSTVNGANVHMAAYNDLTGNSIPYSSTPFCRYTWHVSDRALPVIVDKIRLKEWQLHDLLHYIKRPKKYAIFDPGDPGPFLFSTNLLLKKIKDKIIG